MHLKCVQEKDSIGRGYRLVDGFMCFEFKLVWIRTSGMVVDFSIYEIAKRHKIHAGTPTSYKGVE